MRLRPFVVAFRGGVGDFSNQVRAAKEQVNLRRLQANLPPLRRHEAIFHDMREPHDLVEFDNPRPAFNRVNRPHERV